MTTVSDIIAAWIWIGAIIIPLSIGLLIGHWRGHR